MANVNINALATGQAVGWSGGLQITEYFVAYGSISAEENATATTFSGSSTDFTSAVQVAVFDTNGISSGTTSGGRPTIMIAPRMRSIALPTPT